MNHTRPRPLTLIILDGWGYSPDTTANAIAAARKPHWDDWWQHCPHTLLAGSGTDVGLPAGQMGNSEVGHITMGAGRVVYPDLARINQAIEQGDFFSNPVFIAALHQAKQHNKAVHMMGLLSCGGVHSHENHMHALIDLATQLAIPHLYIHAFLDGRDTPPQSAMTSLQRIMDHCKQKQCGELVSMIGRYYAMDRDQRWDRIQQAYDLVVLGQAPFHAEGAVQGLNQAYARHEQDEWVQATAIHPASRTSCSPITIQDGDSVIFMNFRADRARELTQAFIDPHFQAFARARRPALAAFVCCTQYDAAFNTPVAFPPAPLTGLLGEHLANCGLKQLRIAETEKYAHITFFFNGGNETPYPGEDRILVPSPSIATYDLQPEMHALPLTARLVQAINTQIYDVIICNFANPDMVGHSGNFDATVKAIETIDYCLGEVVPAVRNVGGEVIVTADHGNAEQMFDCHTGQPHTAHTINPVPFIYLGRPASIIKQSGALSDIAPTMLTLLGLPIPEEMTGTSILRIVP